MRPPSLQQVTLPNSTPWSKEHPPEWEVIFVHGLRGDPISTWYSSSLLELFKFRFFEWIDAAKSPRFVSIASDFWPAWIVSDFPNVRVWVASYPTAIVTWFDRSLTCDEIARLLLTEFSVKRISGAKVMMIGHSYGGQVIKAMLVASQAAGTEEERHLFNRLRSIRFLGTPHLGSPIAVRLPWQRSTVAELARANPFWPKLDQQTTEVLNRRKASGSPVLIHNDYESQRIATIAPIPVPPDLDLGSVGKKNALVTAEDHLSLCKLTSRESHVFAWVQKQLESVVRRRPEILVTFVAGNASHDKAVKKFIKFLRHRSGFVVRSTFDYEESSPPRDSFGVILDAHFKNAELFFVIGGPGYPQAFDSPSEVIEQTADKPRSFIFNRRRFEVTSEPERLSVMPWYIQMGTHDLAANFPEELHARVTKLVFSHGDTTSELKFERELDVAFQRWQRRPQKVNV